MLDNRRFELLNRIVADEKSTDAERDAALRELNASETVSQDFQDKELDSYLESISLRPRESQEIRNSLSPASRQLLNDMCYPPFGMVPDAGSEDRLRALLERTGSPMVKQQVISALKTLCWLKDTGRIIFFGDAAASSWMNG